MNCGSIRESICLLFVFALLSAVVAEEGNARDLPLERWQGPRREIAGLDGEYPCAVGYPQRSAGGLEFVSRDALEPGLCRLRLTVRPSHTHTTVAWKGGLGVEIGSGQAVGPPTWKARTFARRNRPETRTVEFVHRRHGPLTIVLRATVDGEAFEQQRAKAEIKKRGAEMSPLHMGEGSEEEALLGADTFAPLSPEKNFYFGLDRAEIQKLSGSARVARVETDRVRYRPGAQLVATVTLRALTTSARGTLRLYLEHGVDDRRPVAERSVRMEKSEQSEAFELTLPEDAALGYALVAQWSSGEDRAEAAEYFTVTDNFYRTAVIYVHPVHNETFRSSYEGLAERLAGAYVNAREVFFWAEEDMVEMSPESDYWFSGQTGYHVSKAGLQAMVRDLQRRGIAVSTYAKFVLSGYLGWDYAYSYPLDHTNQYGFRVGKWGTTYVPALDRFRNKEFVGQGSGMDGLLSKGAGYVPFLPIDPDPTPRNVRTAAEEIIRSVKIFGWDGLRWDGHPRGAAPGRNSSGGARPGKYNARGHRKTRALIRYFKDIVAGEYPDFRHGYNYLSATSNPGYDWAVEDYELDELSRDGGLLMNESIGNHGFGKTFGWYSANLQEEGDLAREHGGFYLAINRAEHARDHLLCALLGYAGGARPYGGDLQQDRALNRYATRFADFVFDEEMRRIVRPDEILAPAAATRLWWDGFVYETPLENGRRNLVVNLLNLDRKERINPKNVEEHDLGLWSGTDPVTFEVDLPPSCELTQAHLIDPFSLNVRPVAIEDGTVRVPAVSLWRVLVLTMKASSETPSLASRWGPPTTEGREREDADPGDPGRISLDPRKTVERVSERWRDLFPRDGGDWWRESDELAEISMTARNGRLLQQRKPVEHYLKTYPYGLRIPADRKLRDNPPDFPHLSPDRNGRLDVFFARGALSERLKLDRALAGSSPVHVEEARYTSSFNGKNHHLSGNLPPGEFSGKDLLVYASVPHAAIGVRQSYAMLEFVRKGGAALFCGGEYAFGKGRYAHTVLDRRLLPVRIIRSRDNRCSPDPLRLEPGPDWRELNAEVDFADEPVFWAWNEVALRSDAGVKVFLKAGNRPVLVGWELGEGRVACLLAMYRGHSDEDTTAFFDWGEWPHVLRAVTRWLAPGALETDPGRNRLGQKELAELERRLERTDIGDMLDSGLEEGLDGGGDTTPMAQKSQSQVLEGEKLRERLRTIERLLEGRGPRAARLLAKQLVRVANIPRDLRARMVAFIRANLCEGLGEVAEPALGESRLPVRGSAYQLLALAGDSRLLGKMKKKSAGLERDPKDRRRYLAMAAAIFRGDALREYGDKHLEKLEAQRKSNKEAYTGGEGFSMKAPEKPLLEAEKLFARIGWLAYMARQDPARYAGPFVRQWARIPQYSDYCDRAIASTRKGMAQGGDREQGRRRISKLREYQAFLADMDTLSVPIAHAVYEKHGERCARALVKARFLLEIKRIINLIGHYPVASTSEEHQILADADHQVLREFARERLQALPVEP